MSKDSVACRTNFNGGKVCIDGTQRASLSNDEANQAGSFCMDPDLPLRLNTQCQMLASQGFAVDAAVARFLEDIGYYRLSSYWTSTGEDVSSSDKVPFDFVMRIYDLDGELREWLWKAIAPIEIKFRSRYAEMLASVAGPLAYRRQELFENVAAFEKSLKNIDKEIDRELKYKGTCEQQASEICANVPIWEVAEITTWGTLSKLYGNTRFDLLAKTSSGRPNDEVSQAFGIRTYLLKSWINHLTQVRNVCAHQNRLYGRTYKVKAKLLNSDKSWSSRRAFPTFLVIKRIYERSWPELWPQMAADLRAIIAAHPGVDLKPLGFPDCWQEVLA